jgi:hypothetical protein
MAFKLLPQMYFEWILNNRNLPRRSVSGQENDSETSDGMTTHFQAHGFTAGMLDCKEQLEGLPIRTYH